MRGKTNLMRSGTNLFVKNNNIELPKIVELSEGTYEEILAMLEAHYKGIIHIGNYWSVGDSINIKLSTMDGVRNNEIHEENIYEFVIIGIEHDNLTNSINGKTKAAITLQTRNILNTLGCMNYSNSNSGGWGNSNRRSWCNNVFKNALPDIINSAIKLVDKKYTTVVSGTFTRSDYCFLTSSVENGKTRTDSNRYIEEGTIYEYYQDEFNRIKYNSTLEAISWWERTTYYTGFSIIKEDGSISYMSTSTNNLGLAPAFCL